MSRRSICRGAGRTAAGGGTYGAAGSGIRRCGRRSAVRPAVGARRAATAIPFRARPAGEPAAVDGAGPYLDGLNPEQREAVEALDGPVLVLAGAGTGKTRVLTTRIAHILATGRAFPGQILAVTFTNKAAREMKERIGALVGGAVEGMPWLGTFHSIGVKILRRHAELVGLKSGFTILDTDDQIRLLKQVIEAEGLDKDRWPARQLAALIDSWKNRGLTPDKVPAGEAFAFANGKGAQLYAAYQKRLKELNACDFGDLLLENLRLFLEHPDVLADYQRRFRYILVDEYQDTNVAQYLWLRLLAQGSPNICCVGDDDQSIYGWRGAEVDNILRFEKDFPGAKVIRLERNYRSTGHILGAAAGLISAQQGPPRQDAVHRRRAGAKVTVTGVWDDEEEARGIGDDIEALQKAGPAAQPDRDPGARLVPDARLRRPLHHHGAALSRHRRPALLRARRRSRTPSPISRSSPIRPTTSSSSASSTCRSAASATPAVEAHARAGPRARDPDVQAARDDRRDRGAGRQGAQGADRPRRQLRALAQPDRHT